MGLFTPLFGPARPAAFAKKMMKATRQAGEQRPCTFDAERFCLSFAGEGAHTMFLHNAYTDYCKARWKDRPGVILQYASVVQVYRNDSADASFEAVRPQLLPRVRERFYYAAFELQVAGNQIAAASGAIRKSPVAGMIVRPLNDALTLEVVIDQPTAIKTLPRIDVERWGVTFEDVLAAARENLWSLSNANFITVRPGLFMSPWRDTHDASRLYLHDLIWQLPVKGRHVAAVPNRNVLLVTGEDDTDGLTALAELIRQVLSDPRPMTGVVFVLDGNSWLPFLPPPGSPPFWPLKSLAMESAARDYAEQKGLLEKVHQKNSQDVFVARQTLMKRDDGSMYTWTSWIDGITNALVPAADRILFGSSNNGKVEQFGFADWDRVVLVLQQKMEPTELYPIRYRITSFPTPDELSALNLQPG